MTSATDPIIAMAGAAAGNTASAPAAASSSAGGNASGGITIQQAAAAQPWPNWLLVLVTVAVTLLVMALYSHFA